MLYVNIHFNINILYVFKCVLLFNMIFYTCNIIMYVYTYIFTHIFIHIILLLYNIYIIYIYISHTHTYIVVCMCKCIIGHCLFVFVILLVEKCSFSRDAGSRSSWWRCVCFIFSDVSLHMCLIWDTTQPLFIALVFREAWTLLFTTEKILTQYQEAAEGFCFSLQERRTASARLRLFSSRDLSFQMMMSERSLEGRFSFQRRGEATSV